MCAALQCEQHRGVLAANGGFASRVHNLPLLLQCLQGGNRVRTTAPVGRNLSAGKDRKGWEVSRPADGRARTGGMRIMGGFRTSRWNELLSDALGSRARFFLPLARFLPEGTGGAEGVAADHGSPVSKTVIGGGEGERAT
jgi:hypothetical protein